MPTNRERALRAAVAGNIRRANAFAETMRLHYDLALEQGGRTDERVAHALNANGLRTLLGNRWTKSSVYTLRKRLASLL